MGLYTGGLLMTVLYVTIIAFFFSTGILAERNPSAITAIQCIPNAGTITQYSGLDKNAIGTGNCFTDVNSGGVNINTQQDPLSTALNAASQLVPGANVIGQIASLVGFVIFGWIIILQIILGVSGPLSVFIWLIGVPLQMLQLFFLAQVVIQILAAIRGGAQVS